MDAMRILFAAIGFVLFGALALLIAGVIVALVVLVLWVAFSLHWFFGAIVSMPIFLLLFGMATWFTTERQQ